MSSRLKLIPNGEPGQFDIPFVITDYSTSYEGELPVLAYYSDYIFYVLDKGGSERVKLVTCGELKKILDKYMFKGTKYIASTYNPTLYYLFPGISSNDNLFKTENNFIPTLPVSDLVRLEVNGFDQDIDLGYSGGSRPEVVADNGSWYINGQDTGRVVQEGIMPSIYIGTNGNWFVTFNNTTQSDIRCIKACDSWFNDISKYNKIVSDIETRVEDLFGYYKDFDVKKEVSDKLGRYSADLSEESLVVSLISGTTYTDTINLEDWILGSKKGTYPISGKLDISYMYSVGGSMYAGMQTIKAFRYEENVTSNNIIINQGEGCPVQIEYMDNILKIYPLYDAVDEVVFTDCTLTIGVL